jgi:Papain-like cysteine protease AvrRpt2
MLNAFVAVALSLASISVPYVPQTDALCGGAAAAMVFRYWGEAHAGVEPFAALVERRAGGVTGISGEVLDRAVRERGWRTERTSASLESLRERLERRQPVIVLIADRRDLFHYVVVVGFDASAVIVHDPAWGPSRHLPLSEFSRLWAASEHWSLVILPNEAGTLPGVARRTETSPLEGTAIVPSTDRCDLLLSRAIADVGARGLDDADSILGEVRAHCPASAGPLRELAGVRFAQKRWKDATALAREALAIAPGDAYALEVLASSRFMEDDPIGALRAWNQIDRPQLDLVRIEGLRHARYQTIAEALRLRPNTLLTADAFQQASHRLNELPDRSTARLAVRPEADGFASVDVVIAERAGLPRGLGGWASAGVRAGVDREAALSLPGFAGQGEVWTASWRWWNNRPRVAVGFAAPRVGGLFGVWRVEGSWEAETYTTDGIAFRRESRQHAGLSVSDWLSGQVRYSINAGLDSWDTGRKAASVGGSIERRWFRDRLSVGGDVMTWLGIEGRGFQTGGVRATGRSSTDARDWVYQATIGSALVSNDAPLALWPGAGEGRARSELLRAHPLLDAGILDVSAQSAFGRSIIYGSAEAQRWFARPRLVRLGAAAFVDVADARRQLSIGTSARFTDIGAGLRVRVPGVNKVLRIDVAHGLQDGADALTIGWVY